MDTSKDRSAGAPHTDCVGGLRAGERDAGVCECLCVEGALETTLKL